MGYEINETIEEDFESAESVGDLDTEEIAEDVEEDFEPAESVGDLDTEEIAEDVEEDFEPAESVGDLDTEEIAEDVEEDFEPAESVGDLDTEEIAEDVEEDFEPAESVGDLDTEEIAEDVEENFETEGNVEEVTESIDGDFVSTEEIEEKFESEDDLEQSDIKGGETEINDSDESEETESVKVLKRNGDTSTYVHHYEDEIADLDKGIENAKQPYIEAEKDICKQCDVIVNDKKKTVEDKISALEDKKKQLSLIKSEWEKESSEWYEEKNRLRRKQMKNDVGQDINLKIEIDDSQSGVNSEEIRTFADQIRSIYSEDIADSLSTTRDVKDEIDYSFNVGVPKPIDGMEIIEPIVDIFPLEKTNQSINIVELKDGTKQKVFDHPDRLLERLPFSQGINDFNKEGTCALANLGSWLEIGGSSNVENDIVRYASTHMDRHGDSLCSESGGVLPENIPIIWKQFGVDAYLDSSKNLENIAEAVECGRAVSVGVNAGRLYENDNVENINLNDCYGDGGANHAIGVMSCARDAMTGNLTHFYINDTGRDLARDACRKINVVDFLRALNVKREIAIISKKPIW